MNAFEARLREELEERGVTLIGIKKPLSDGDIFGEPFPGLPEHLWYVLAQTEEVATTFMIESYVFEDEDAAVGVADCICVALENVKAMT